MKLSTDEKSALKAIKDELFKKYSAYEYRKAFSYVMKHRKEYKSQEDVRKATFEYLEKNHEHNKCWKNKLN